MIHSARMIQMVMTGRHRLMTDVAWLLLLLLVLLSTTAAAAAAAALSRQRLPVSNNNNNEYDDDQQQLDSKLQLHYAGEFVVTLE